MIINIKSQEIARAKPLKVISWSEMKKAAPVEEKNISNIRNTSVRMIKTCLQQEGVGLSANQVGIPSSFFVMEILDTNNFIICVNPSYKFTSSLREETLLEGCLSSDKEYFVSRNYEIYASWTNIDGMKPETRFLTGLQSRIFQHETDHLSLIDISMIGSLKTDKSLSSL